MGPVPRHEMIDCQSWYEIVDYHYDNNRNDFPSGVIHCDMGSIPEFFEKIRFLPQKYVVVSSRSDYGLHYQEQFPPYTDYSKAATMFFSNPNYTHGGYDDIVIPARINKNRCYPSDRYSIRMYSFTEATFPEIPKNVVKWFVCNNTIQDDSRITSIPFGINGVDGNKGPGDQIFNKAQSLNWYGDHASDMYVNFQFYTNERMKLWLLYKDMGFGRVEKDVPFDYYLDQLACHNCNLCPPGNGWDCYRNLESLYMGCIPIMELNPGTTVYTKLNLPIIFTSSLEAVTKPVLRAIRESSYYDRRTWDLSKIYLSYWKNKIEKSRELL